MSITEAARQLYISQPAVSKTIRELESHIGVSIFDRINGKLFLSEEGKVFRIKATQLIRDFDDLENFRDYCKTEIPLRIGTSLTIAMNSLPHAAKQFKIKYPQTPLRIYSENVQQVQNRLLNGEIDLAFIEGFESNQGFHAEPISEYALLLVCSAHSRFAMKTEIDREDLFKLPFLLREKGSTLRDCFDGLTHEFKVDLSPVLESINTEVLIRSTKAGMGITVLPEPLAREYLKSGEFVCLHLNGRTMSTVNYAVTLKGKSKNEIYVEMIECFKNAETNIP
ncbi:MAG TPA: LysR family transcriptional regulator [Clostridiales bacterium]|nr:LysR family transcriptional regulator [Clostridiales bacterium]